MVTPAMGAAMIGQVIPYGKTGLNMAAVGFVCAPLLFRVLYLGNISSCFRNKPSKNVDPDEDDLELRVAALRSAVMRKAEFRKKRRMQGVGQVPGDETTPVDMDLADTDDEEDPSPEHPALPMPPLPSEELLNAIRAPCYFSDPAHFLPSFMDQPLENLPPEMPLFPMGQEPTSSPDLVRFPSLECEGVPHPVSYPPMQHEYEFPPAHPIEFSAPPPEFTAPPPEFTAPPPEFTAPPPEFSAPPPEFSAPPPEFSAPPPEFSAPPPEFPPLEYPPPTIEYQPEPSVEYDPAIPTTYPDLPPPFISETWDQEQHAPSQLEPLSSLLTKAMKKKLQNTRPNLLEIKVNQPAPKKSEQAPTPAQNPTPVAEVAAGDENVGGQKLERQASIDEDEKSLRERLLKAISSKREMQRPEKTHQSKEPVKTNIPDEPSNTPDEAGKAAGKAQTKIIPPETRSKKEVLVSKPKTSNVLSKVTPNPRQPFVARKSVKQKTAKQPSSGRFIIQLGEDSDSSDGLDVDEPLDVRKEAVIKTNMYHMKDYCPRSGAGDSEKAVEETISARSESDLSKEVDKFLKDVRSSHEASTAAPDSPTPSQVAQLKPIHVTPLVSSFIGNLLKYSPNYDTSRFLHFAS